MAAPHVAGVAGLLVAQGCTRDQILYLFEQTSRQPPLDERGQWTPLYGYGIVDADASTAAAAELCDPRLAPAPPSDSDPEEPATPEDANESAPPPAAPNDSAPPPVACSNHIDGTSAADRLLGSDASELLFGRRGDDRLKGRAGDDCLRGGAGVDRLAGEAEADQLNGGAGHDRIRGGIGDDRIRAARGGRDEIDCGPGDDVAFVNARKDTWRGCERVRER